MYLKTTTQDVQDSYHLSDVGFSLKPPAWLRQAVSSAVQAIKPKITLNTPAGPVTVDPTNATEIRQTISQLRPSVTFGAQPPTLFDRVSAGVDAIPGGGVTLALAGGALLLLLMSRRRG